jgi:tetratricopeptide (TPR) repeat protein
MPMLETASIGKAVAARVGIHIRQVRTKLGLTQAQLAAPEFSISYISAIEYGKIRPSLKALSILARRLDVPLTSLLEGHPAEVSQARPIGYSPIDAGPDQRIEVDLLLASILVQQQHYKQAEQLLAPFQPERITTDQVYRLSLLRGQIHLGVNQYQAAVVDLRSAVTQGEAMSEIEYSERARNLLGRAYYHLSNYRLALENHVHCHTAIEHGLITDPFFELEVFRNLASDYLQLADLEKSELFSRRALEQLEGMPDSRSYAQKFLQIAEQYKAAGKLPWAHDFAMRSLAISEMRDEQRERGLTHHKLGQALEKQNELDAAEQEYRQAISIETDLNDDAAASTCSTSLAELLLKRGKAAEAEKEVQKAQGFARASRDPQAQGQALMALAQIHQSRGDESGADKLFKQALDLLDSSNAHDVAAGAYLRYATLLEERGDIQGSLSAIKTAYEHQRLDKPGERE